MTIEKALKLSSVGIMQPTYIPWLGYFEMINKTDTFVFLDNVEFNHKSWQHRNRILSSHGELLLSIPIRTSGYHHQLILEVEMLDRDSAGYDFRKKHWKSIEQSYSKHKFFEEISNFLKPAILFEESKLAVYNVNIIKQISRYLGLDTKFIFGSQLLAKGKATKLTVNQCVELNADVFYCANGAKEYVSNEMRFAQESIEVIFQDYNHPIYPQQSNHFVSYLSIVDCLFNCGMSTRMYL